MGKLIKKRGKIKVFFFTFKRWFKNQFGDFIVLNPDRICIKQILWIRIYITAYANVHNTIRATALYNHGFS